MVAWTLPNDGPLTDEQRRAAMGNFKRYIDKRSFTIADVAHELGTPKASTIRELTLGTYREGSDAHIRTLNNWIEQNARRRAVKLKNDFDSTTKVAKDIFNVARMVRENSTMGLVFGPAGIGKSRCSQAVYEVTAGAILVRTLNSTRTPKGLIGALADVLHCRSAHRNAEHAKQTQEERVIAKLAESNRLIIIDEAHKLTTDAVEVLRDIHDAAGVPILLVATRDLHTRILRSLTPDLGQLYSRFDIILSLVQGHDPNGGDGKKPLFTIEQIKKICAQPQIRLARDAEEYLSDIANQLGYGSMRRCKIVLVNGARAARKRQGVSDEDPVTVHAEDLERAEGRLRSDRTEREMAAQRRRRLQSQAQAQEA